MTMRTSLIALAFVAASPVYAQPLVVSGAQTISSATTVDSLTVQSGGVLTLNARLTVLGDAVIEAGGVVTHDQGNVGMELDVAGTLDVRVGGRIDVAGKGLLGGNRAGNGFGVRGQTINPLTLLVEAGPGQANGGSHGGRGATFDGNQPAPPEPFGVQVEPASLGGGGGGGGCGAIGGNGGGRVFLRAATVRVDGIVSADGTSGGDGCSGFEGAGGGGGSIWIEAQSFAGSGSITAQGGVGFANTANGGGGRIYATFTTRTYSGGLSASSPPAGIQSAAGTSFLLADDGLVTALTVQGGHAVIDDSTTLTSVTLAAASTLFVRGGARVTNPIVIPAGSTVELEASNALSALTLNGTIAGTLRVDTATTFPSSISLDGVLVVNDRLDIAGDITVNPLATITHDNEQNDAILAASGTINVRTGGAIDVSGRGLRAGRSVDPLTLQFVTTPGRAGGSHGGRGGPNGLGAYDDARAPVLAGSGGGAGPCGEPGGAGGGVIAISAAVLRVDGTLRANGANGVDGCGGGSDSGGGGGGTVFAQVDTLSGGGVISALGGNGNDESGGGGGGRVALFFTTKTFSGVVNAQGGGPQAGAPGSVHMQAADGALTAEGGELPLVAGDSFTSVTLRPLATLRINGAAAVAAPIVISAGATVELNSEDALDFIDLDPTILGALRVNVPTALPTTTIGNGGNLVVNSDLDVAGNLTLLGGGSVTHDVAVTTFDLNVSGTLDVRIGGRIDATGKGLRPGPVAGFGNNGAAIDPATLLVRSGSALRAGGSHGGLGGQTFGAAANAVYGDLSFPDFLGAGGGSGPCGEAGGGGGGRVVVTAGTLIVNGEIRADGQNGSADGCGGGNGDPGGGAGGSVRIAADVISGSGVISADGGLGENEGSGGGGGRVRLDVNTNSHSGAVRAQGKDGGQKGTANIVDVDSDTVVVGDGRHTIDAIDQVASITVRSGGVLDIRGPASVTQPIVVAAGTTVILSSIDALAALDLNSTISGTLVVNAPTTLPSTTIGNGGTLVVNSELDIAGDLTVLAGGVVTHDVAVSSFDLSVSGTLDVRIAGRIDASAKGLRGGPFGGFGNNGAAIDPATLLVAAGSALRAGGSHGGRGGETFGARANAPYGDLAFPDFLGSGGGTGPCGEAGGTGGGRLVLAATTLIANGEIRADGQSGAGDGCGGGNGDPGGGSGGSVRIFATTIAGSGVISADGGVGENEGSGGGGGRVRIDVTTDNHNGAVRADGRDGGFDGSASVVDVDNDTVVVGAGTHTINGADNVASVTVGPGGVLNIVGPAAVTQPIVVAAGATVILDSSDALDALTLDPNIAGTLIVNAATTLPTTTVAGGATLIVNSPLSVDGNLTVLATGLVTHDAGVSTFGLDVSGTLDVRTGGRVDASGKGLRGGPFAGFGNNGAAINPATLLVAAGSALRAGGSHGGLGGQTFGASANAVYGDPQRPDFLGAGGGTGPCGEPGGDGGGRLVISATTLIQNGEVRANGRNGAGDGCGGGNGDPGGGAGGSVRITVTSLSGSGPITADGGVGENEGSGGGGGRVHIELDNNAHSGVVSAAGLDGGRAGTVNVVDVGNDNLFVAGGVRTLVAGDDFNSVVLGANGVLDMRGPARVTLPIRVPAGSTVILSSSDALANLELDPSIDGTLIVNADSVIDDDVILSGLAIVNRTLQVGSLEALSGALLTHDLGVTTFNLFVAEDLVLRAGSQINVTAKGLLGAPQAGFGGRGATIDPLTLLVTAGSGTRNGGSHGAAGGAADGAQPVAGPYDDVADPRLPGGGGGQGPCGEPGGNGGGVVRIAANVFVHDGIIAADGTNGVDGCGTANGDSGGGAGGSVVVAAGDLSGQGPIFARGGNGENESGGGAGGIVVVGFATSSYTGGVQVNNGGPIAGGNGSSSTGLADQPPSILTTPPQNAQVGRLYRYRPLASGSPVLTWSLQQSPAGAQINAATGELTFVPTTGDPVAFTIRVSNAIGIDDQAFTLSPTQAPIITSTPAASVIAGQPYHYDADDTAEAAGTPPITWSAPTAPPGFAIDALSGFITWTPSSTGTFPVCIEASSGFGDTAQCFTVVATPPPGSIPPTITSTPAELAFRGIAYEYDSDGIAEALGDPPISWRVLAGPPGFTISATGAVGWTPIAEGQQSACIVASNLSGEDTQCFTVDVLPQGPPIFVSAPATLALEGAPYAYDEDNVIDVVGPDPITLTATTAPAGFSVDDTGLVTWTPDSAGDFDVVLRAANALGASEQRFTVTVLPAGANAAPVIVPSGNPFAAVGVPYIYDADSIADAGGPTPITWQLVDGPAGYRIDATSGLVSWFPDVAGDAAVTLRATNAFGSDTYSYTIDVIAEAGPDPTPVAAIDPTSGDAPLFVTADGAQSFAAPGQAIVFYRWVFGDGTVPTDGAVVEHTYERPGSYVARLRVADQVGSAGEASVVVSVLDDGVAPPRGRILVSQVEGNDELQVSFSCDCSAGSAPIEAFLWDFGDGERADLPAVTHTFGPGGFEVRLTVVDQNGLTAVDSVAIRVSNAGNLPPLVVASAAPPFGNAPFSTSFLATAGDVDGAIASYSWSFGDGGTAADAAPLYTYVAPGTYLATVTVTDDQGLSSTASVELDVSNADGVRPPQILSLPILTGAVGVPYVYDEDGIPAARGDRPLVWSLGKNVGGNLVGAPAGMSVDGATGRITWTPAADQGGAILVSLVASNGASAVAQDFEIDVAGGAPPLPEPPPEGCACGTNGDGTVSGMASRSGATLTLFGMLAVMLRIRRAGARPAPGPPPPRIR